jgi:transposase
MNTEETQPKRPYFRPTTPQQRRLLFETYEATKDVEEACRTAHVGRGTFYYWRPRYEAGGYEGLEQERSRAPHRTRIAPIVAAIKEEVIVYKGEHPQAGYRSIANALQQAHQWQRVISPSQVRRILLQAGLVKPRPPEPEPVAEVGVVHAPEPDQTVNIDLCVVPVSHTASEVLRSTSVASAVRGDFSPGRADG